jgi:hypothetical protein
MTVIPSYPHGYEDLYRRAPRDFMTAQIAELLTNYGPIAGIWLDGIAVPLSGDRTKFVPDGSLDDEDTDVLRAVGARLRPEGFPAGC